MGTRLNVETRTGLLALDKLRWAQEALRDIAFHVPTVCYEHDDKRYVDIEEVYKLKRIAADVRTAIIVELEELGEQDLRRD